METNYANEIFSFHLLKLPLLRVPQFVFSLMHKNKIPGLKHSESFFTMNLGEPILSGPRYNLKSVAFFARWSDEDSLNNFLNDPLHQHFNNGWHVRLRLYRSWGKITELQDAHIFLKIPAPDKPVIAVTLARLNLLETLRFIRWGKPVERQVRDHSGQSLALAALRPLRTFSTFSIWKNESEMLNMVHGNSEDHKHAMKERARKDFHKEFMTMRFIPIKEVGSWNGKDNHTLFT